MFPGKGKKEESNTSKKKKVEQPCHICHKAFEEKHLCIYTHTHTVHKQTQSQTHMNKCIEHVS